MPKTALLLAAAATLATAGAAVAQGRPAPAFNPDVFVAARQASLDMSSVVLGSMRDAMKAGQDAKTQAYVATGLAKWSKVLPTLFVAGSGIGEATLQTQAKPLIWNDRAGFEQAAANYAAAADKLVAFAKANDTDGFKAQLAEVSRKCDACHAVYKAGPQGPPK
jgi:cytochrome c556